MAKPLQARRMVRRREAGSRGGGDPWGPIAVLLLLVGALAATTADVHPTARAVIENPTERAWSVDVVWRAAGGGVSGSLIRVVEPTRTLTVGVRPGVEGCVRVIDQEAARVEGAWSLPPGPPDRPVVVLGPSLPSLRPDVPGDGCAQELVEHRIRPRPGRWMSPREPERLRRERLIPRALPRRALKRRISRRRRWIDRLRSWTGWTPLPGGTRMERRATYWHLTPREWVRGGWESVEVSEPDRPPDDRVKTCAYVEDRPTRLARGRRRVRTLWIRQADHASRLTSRPTAPPASRDSL